MLQSSNIYKSFKYKRFDYTRIISEFNKDIFFNAFFRNKNYLLSNSKNIPFDKGVWVYRPDVFCNDYYDVPHYYHIVLLVNNLGSVFEFHPDNLLNSVIIAPEKEAINGVTV